MSDGERGIRPQRTSGAATPQMRRAMALAAIFERSATAMVVVDDARKYLDVNAAAELLHGRSRLDILGRALDDFLVSDQDWDLGTTWDGVLTGKDVSGTFQLVRHDESRVEVEYSATANFLSGRHLLILFRHNETPTMPVESSNGTLSTREREVLTLLATGVNGREIADSLDISPETVRTHIRNAMDKLGARTRAHAIVLALRGGEIAP